MVKERIGLMGGSFNPIHSGHIHMALAALKSAELDRVLFVPSGNPPHKRITQVTNQQRYEMLIAAIGREKAFSPSRIELDREGIIYSVDTLSLLKEQYPKGKIFFIIGEDTLHELNTWRAYEKVFTLCTFLVVHRENASDETYTQALKKMQNLGAKIEEVPMELYLAASTEIRSQLASGLMPQCLPAAVQAYIGLMGLYGYSPYLNNAAPLVDKLFNTLSPGLFAHSLGVCQYARHLAQIHGVDLEAATLAGLLHDCAKSLPLESQQKLSRETDPALLSSVSLLHASAGESLAKAEYGIIDETVLHAIYSHTLGRKEMNKLDMVTYLADKIELGRKPYKGLEALRALAQTDLQAAVILSMESTLDYLTASHSPIHPTLNDSLSWLKTHTI